MTIAVQGDTIAGSLGKVDNTFIEPGWRDKLERKHSQGVSTSAPLDLAKVGEELRGARDQLSQVDKSLDKIHSLAAEGQRRVQKAEDVRKSAEEVMQQSAVILARSSPADLALSCSADFDKQWKAFQQRFDDLLSLSVAKLSGTAVVKPTRPAEAISEIRTAQVLARAQRLVVLTGAGISAESGIPTFRGSDGFWSVGSKNYTPQEMATWERYNERPEDHWRWCQYRFGLCRTAKSNPGHHALVDMEKLVNGGHGFTLVTQNIDSLHLQAGSDPNRLCEIHGRICDMRCDERVPGSCLHGVDLQDADNFTKVRATIAETPMPAAVESEESLPTCRACGKRMRPKILWFDESYNESVFRSKTASAAVEKCDVLLIIGTQLTTGLPSRLVQSARSTGAVIIKLDPEVDLNEPRFDGMLHLPGASGEVLPRLVQMIRDLRKGPELALLTAGSALSTVRPAGSGGALAGCTSRTSSTPAPRRSTIAGSGSAAALALKHGVNARTSRRSDTAKSRSSSTASIRAAAEVALRLSPKSPQNPGRPGSQKATDGPVGIFVCGSLRPDSDEAESTSFPKEWTSMVATLPSASLYVQDGKPVLALEQTRCSVRGVLLIPPGQDPLGKHLELADKLELFAVQTDRTECTVYTNAGHRRAYVYHASGRFQREVANRLLDGDWLSRPKGPPFAASGRPATQARPSSAAVQTLRAASDTAGCASASGRFFVVRSKGG